MKTTIKQFEVFEREARSWIKTLGLRDYDVHFIHDELEESIAQCGTNEQAKLCKLWLNKDYQMEGVPFTTLEVKKTACHEVLELLFSRIRALADNKNGTPELVDEEIHRLIQTFINCFYDGLKN